MVQRVRYEQRETLPCCPVKSDIRCSDVGNILMPVEIAVHRSIQQQFLVGSPLDDLPPLNDEDQIGPLNCRQPVRDDERGPVSYQLPDGAQDV